VYEGELSLLDPFLTLKLHSFLNFLLFERTNKR
jgi:hypothetical protein